MISKPLSGGGKIAAISLRTLASNAPSVEPSALSISKNPPNVRNRRSASMPGLLGRSNARSPARYRNGVSCSVSEVGVTVTGSLSTSIDVRLLISHAIRLSAVGRGFHDVPVPSCSCPNRNLLAGPIAAARRAHASATSAAAPPSSSRRSSMPGKVAPPPRGARSGSSDLRDTMGPVPSSRGDAGAVAQIRHQLETLDPHREGDLPHVLEDVRRLLGV